MASDPRPDALLEECGRLYWRLNVALAWTDGLADDRVAKTCSRGGRAAWKAARPFREQVAEEVAAGAYFKERARKRNPVVTAAAGGLDLVEYDGNRDELDRKHGIPRLPNTLGWRSRRGPHLVFRAPAGEAPVKIQVDDAGVTVASDGYLVCAPGWRAEHGVVYELNGAHDPVRLPAELRRQLLDQGARKRTETRRRFAAGEPIPKGHRTVALFWFAVELLRAGTAPAEALERTLAAARERCRPPLDPERARAQFKGAVKFVHEHPTETDRARAEAQRILRDRRNGERAGEGTPQPPRGRRRRSLERRSLRTVAAEPVEWVIDRIIPLGTLSLVAGVGGLGKSGLLLAWAKEITDAGGHVLIVSYEDAAAQVIRPRFEALGGDLDRLHELYVDVLDGSVSFPTDLPELDRHLRETQARAVLIDPISASIDLRLDAHKDQDVRVVLGQLAHLAERQRVAIPMNAHLNKAPSSDPYLRINGSTAFYHAARSVLTVTRDPDEPDWQRLVAHHKSNYGPLAPVERWRVVPVTVAGEQGPIEAMTMQFIEIADDVVREDVLASHPDGVEKLDEAVAFLQEALADGDWHDSATLVRRAGEKRISERTLRRAALDELEVEHERRGFPSSTWWRLPSHATPSPHDLA
jgi:AAA domain